MRRYLRSASAGVVLAVGASLVLGVSTQTATYAAGLTVPRSVLPQSLVDARFATIVEGVQVARIGGVAAGAGGYTAAGAAGVFLGAAGVAGAGFAVGWGIGSALYTPNSDVPGVRAGAWRPSGQYVWPTTAGTKKSTVLAYFGEVTTAGAGGGWWYTDNAAPGIFIRLPAWDALSTTPADPGSVAFTWFCGGVAAGGDAGSYGFGKRDGKMETFVGVPSCVAGPDGGIEFRGTGVTSSQAPTMSIGLTPGVNLGPAVPSPTRLLVNTSECTTSAGVKNLVSVTSAPFTEADPVMPDMTVPDCGPVTQRTRWTVTSVPQTPGQVPAKVLVDVTFPTPEQLPQYSECLGAARCTLERVPGVQAPPVTEPGPDGVPVPGGAGAPAPAAPETCSWGPYTMPAGDCVGLPDPAPAPVPVPGQSDGACFPSGWGLLNPVQWVLQPTKCALVWAFVPGDASTAQLDELGQLLRARAPLSYLVDAGDWVTTVLGGTGDQAAPACLVYNVHLGDLGTFHVIDSCADEAIPNAIRPMRPLLLIAVYAGFLGPLAWWAWRSYAPLSRPQG